MPVKVLMKRAADGNNGVDAWAVGLTSDSFRLLCPDGGTRPVQEFQTCNLGKVPAPKVSACCLTGGITPLSVSIPVAQSARLGMHVK